MSKTINIDGSLGEGGGQVLRSSLALSLLTGQSLDLTHIRAGRSKPGLMRQHLTCVNAAAAIGDAEVAGAEIGSQQLQFTPGKVRAGDYRFAVGTAGSAHLVLQAILPPLLLADGPSTVRIEGGTHNPLAPPADFIARSFLPFINAMGAQVQFSLERHGFYPAGGGAIVAQITPVRKLLPLVAVERGALVAVHAETRIAQIGDHVGERELSVLRRELEPTPASAEMCRITDSAGPGNYVMVAVEHEQVCLVFSGFGESQVPAERIAGGVAKAANRYIGSGAVADEFLTDQLLLPMALAGNSAISAVAISRHASTNMDIIHKFLGTAFVSERKSRLEWIISTKS